MHALVISGDAARGSFQAGALMQLLRAGQAFDGVYGTSSGALNACLYAYCTPEQIQTHWENIKHFSDFYGFNGLAALWRPGLFNNNPLQELIRGSIHNNPRCKVTVSVTDMHTSRTGYVTNAGPHLNHFIQAVAASASIPGLCSPTGPWADGGMRAIAPIRKALDDGCKDITLLLSRPWSPVFNPDWRPDPGLKFLKYMQRALDIILHEVAWQNVQETIPDVASLTVYAPTNVIHMHLLDFDPAKVRQSLEDGQKATPIKVK